MWCLQDQLFILCIALSCVTSAAGLIRVTGYEGGEAKVPCPYGEGYQTHEKYLCKKECKDNDVLITTTQVNKSKYSIYDDKKKRVFTATISGLSQMDVGKYRCGVEKIFKDIYTEVKLDIVTDTCCDSVNKIQSYEGGSVSISCQYDPEYQNNQKYMCRGNRPSTCLQQAVVTSNNKQTGQYSLTDDKERRTFTVTITGLAQNDSGLYLCGVHRNTGLDVFSAVELEVKDAAQFHSVVVIVVVVVLLILILTAVIVIIYKYKCCEVQGAGVNRNRDTAEAADAEMVIDEADIYENQDYVDCSKQRLRKQLITCHHDDETSGDQQDSVYQNFITTEDVYYNDVSIKFNKR